jgi:hypothetical protein
MVQKETIHRVIIELGQSITKVITPKRLNFNFCAYYAILALLTLLLH